MTVLDDQPSGLKELERLTGRTTLKLAKYILIGTIVLFGGAQFVRPDRTNPPAANPYPIGGANVESILKRSCYDCHSNETRWPWYSEIAPISWQIVNHVNDGRKHVNFSDWDEKKAPKRLKEICDEVRDGGMPVTGYVPLHPDAKLTADDVNTLCAWSGALLTALGEPAASNDDDEREH